MWLNQSAEQGWNGVLAAEQVSTTVNVDMQKQQVPGRHGRTKALSMTLVALGYNA